MKTKSSDIYKDLYKKAKYISVQEVQAGVTKVLRDAAKSGNFYRVMRNNKPIGVLIPNEEFDDILENMEALSSPNFLKSLEEADKEEGGYAQEEIEEKYGIR